MAPPWSLGPIAESWGSLNTANLAGWKEGSRTQHNPPGAETPGRCSELSSPTFSPISRAWVPPFPSGALRDADEAGPGLGTRLKLVLCRARARSARGRCCGAWVALGVVTEQGWGPGLEAEQDGVVAREACRHLSENRRRAGSAGCGMRREMGQSLGPAETTEIGVGGRKGRSRRGTHTRRRV